MKTLHLFFIRLCLIAVFCCLSAASFGQEDKSNRPRVAVVLSGGGAKGMAHIGVLKVIERAGIPVDIVTGTSMGSIIGGLYSIGWNATALDTTVRKQDWAFLLSDRSDYYSQNLHRREKQNTYALSKSLTIGRKQISESGGMIAGVNLAKLFKHLTQGYTDSLNFSKLPIPFACVATNIVDNSEYVFRHGVLAEAMRASMSIPGVFTPVRKGNCILVDGGLRNNYPADIARDMGAQYIIGITVQGPPKTADDLSGGASILGQIVDINCKNKYDDNIAITDIPIRVNTKGYGSASFSAAAIDTLIRRGEEAAMQHWDQLMLLKERLGYARDYHAALLQPSALALQPVVFADSVVYQRPEHDRVTGNVAVRFDNEEMVALQLNGEYQMAKRGIDLEATLRLGKRIMVNTTGSYTLHNMAKAEVSYTFRHNDLDVYDYGQKDYTITYNHHQAAVRLVGLGVRNLAADLTFRWDYYHYDDLLVRHERSDIDRRLLSDHYFSYHANLHYDSENNGIFATKGARFNAEYAYFTDNLATYNGGIGFSELNAMWRMSFALNSQFTIQPQLYGRMLFGRDIPSVRRNMMGGIWFGHYLEQQMPFDGISYLQRVDNHTVACRIKGQYQLTTNNFILSSFTIAQQADHLRQLLKQSTLWGASISYCYRTVLGPIGATVAYANVPNKVSVYLNLGFEF